jgi:hypothetical protein
MLSVEDPDPHHLAASGSRIFLKQIRIPNPNPRLQNLFFFSEVRSVIPFSSVGLVPLPVPGSVLVLVPIREPVSVSESNKPGFYQNCLDPQQ